MATSAFHHNDHWRALCIALASSTDNVLVGFSLGMGRDQYTWWILVVGIAIVNAGGGWLATVMGAATTDNMFYYFHPNTLAGVAFLVLAYNEIMGTTVTGTDQQTTASPAPRPTDSKEHPQQQQRRRHAASQSFFKMTQLAIPMTLNNLAGGIATGVAGVPPRLAAVYVLLVSLIGMAAGLGAAIHYFRRQQQQQQQRSSTTGRFCIHWSAALYAAVGIQCIIGAWWGAY